MKDENDKKQAEQRTTGGYEAPKVVRVSLRPDEAVLGHCKVTGSAGPVSGSCKPGGLSCRTQGS